MTTGLNRRYSHGHIKTWSSLQCSRCGRFLAKFETKFCKKCCHKGYEVNRLRNYFRTYIEQAIRETTGISLNTIRVLRLVSYKSKCESE